MGIVTSFTIRTYPAPAITTFFSTNWALPSTGPTLDWFQRQAPAFPDELSTDFSVSSSQVQFSGVYLGSKADLQGILNMAGYQTLPPKKSEEFDEMSYIDTALHNAVLSQSLTPANDINALGLGPGLRIHPMQQRYFCIFMIMIFPSALLCVMTRAKLLPGP